MLPVVIIAGGLATRLKSRAHDRPKSMLVVNEKPFIDWQLNMLASQGVEKVIICIGNKGDQIASFVGNGSRYGIEIFYSSDGEFLLGTGGAVQKASKLVQGKFLVTYGDSYLPISFFEFSKKFEDSKKNSAMAVYKNDNLYDKSNIDFIDGEILTYSKNDVHKKFKYIDYGLLGLNSNTFPFREHNSEWDLSILLNKLVIQKEILGIEVHNRFYEIGSESGIFDLEIYMRGLSNDIH
jgi:NDP-sugar pyrophosphorylase family protein